jgi:hypothetical protein
LERAVEANKDCHIDNLYDSTHTIRLLSSEIQHHACQVVASPIVQCSAGHQSKGLVLGLAAMIIASNGSLQHKLLYVTENQVKVIPATHHTERMLQLHRASLFPFP